MPGYSHLQIAMPSSFGLWFSSYAESLIDDLIFLNSAIEVVNQNPLGSAAGFGSTFPIDRIYTTKKFSISSNCLCFLDSLRELFYLKQENMN